jgi:transcriptional regulator with XRE-family HTH domain
MKKKFDPQIFYAALDAQREIKKLSWRQIAKEVGVAPSTFTRLAQGKLPDAEHFIAIMEWLGLDLSAFDIMEAGRKPTTLTIISIALRNDPCLSSEDAALVDSLVRSAYGKLCKDKRNAKEYHGKYGKANHQSMSEDMLPPHYD